MWLIVFQTIETLRHQDLINFAWYWILYINNNYRVRKDRKGLEKYICNAENIGGKKNMLPDVEIFYYCDLFPSQYQQ